MKFTVTESDRSFCPIHVSLTLATEDELFEFLARLNVNMDAINQFNSGQGYCTFSEHNFTDLWDSVDDIARERGLIDD
jgi:hypothetical protein